jgi:hypothetical protein
VRYCNWVRLSIIKDPLPRFEIYDQVHGQPFLRVYGKFAKPIPELSVYTVVPGPLQKIIPVNIRDGVYMIAYSETIQFLVPYSPSHSQWLMLVPM